jgi:Ca2+-binding RTX toxin-like protein
MWTVAIGSLGGVSQSVAAQSLAVVQAAANYWSWYIDDSLANIEIEINFAPLPILFAEGGTTIHFRGSSGGFDYYDPATLIELTTGVDPNGAEPDISITIDTLTIDAGEFYYGLPANGYLSTPGPGQFDLFTIILHEIAHGLGILTLIDQSATARTAFDEHVTDVGGSYVFDAPGLAIQLDGSIAHLTSGLLGTNLTPGGTFQIAQRETAILEKFGIPIERPSEGADTLIGYADIEYIDLLGGDDIFTDLGGSGSVGGGEGDDTIIGSVDPDSVEGGVGNDVLRTSAGIDFLRGQAGDDRLVGEAGGDDLEGGDGADTLNGGDGDDVLEGGPGRDRLVGGAGQDIANYDFNSAALFADLGAASIRGGDADGDVIMSIEGIAGGRFDDTLIGGAGADWFAGGPGADLMMGGAGDDVIVAGEGLQIGMDTVIGGAGADDLQIGYASVVLVSYAGSTAVAIDLANRTASGGDAQGEIIGGLANVEGSAQGDVILGNEYYNLILGSGGSDILTGAEDNDTIDGGDGSDTIDGGSGDDSLAGGVGRDVVTSGSGADIVDAGTGDDAVLGGTQRDSVFGGSGFDRIDGGDGNDTVQGGNDRDKLTGGGGYDILDGGAGDDILDGGALNDVIFTGAGADTIVFRKAGGVDTLRDFSPGAGDVIRLIGFGAAFDSFAEILAAASDNGANTTIDFGGGDVIVLRGVLVSQLAADDFAFG